MKKHDCFLYKNIRFALFLERVEIGRKCEKETGRRRTRTQTNGGLLYWPFLKPRCDSIFRASFLDDSLSTGFCQGATWPPLPLGLRWPLSKPPDRLTGWQTDCLTWVPVYIWFHNAYTSFRFVIHMMCLHPRLACFPVITLFTRLEHPVPEILDWWLSQGPICHNNS